MNEQTSATPSTPPVRLSRLVIIAGILLVVTGLTAWQLGLLGGSSMGARANSILVIAPYRHQGTWVFDDASAGLVQEPFVAGVPEMIDVLVKEIPRADEGFRLLFSASPFPGYQKELKWLRGDMGGNYYALNDPPMEGWICPALFKYYDEPPPSLYVKAEEMKR